MKGLISKQLSLDYWTYFYAYDVQKSIRYKTLFHRNSIWWNQIRHILGPMSKAIKFKIASRLDQNCLTYAASLKFRDFSAVIVYSGHLKKKIT